MTDLNEEMRQRRALIERWASADQAFRDVRHPVKLIPHSGVPLIYSSSLIKSVLLNESQHWTILHIFFPRMNLTHNPSSASLRWIRSIIQTTIYVLSRTLSFSIYTIMKEEATIRCLVEPGRGTRPPQFRISWLIHLQHRITLVSSLITIC